MSIWEPDPDDLLRVIIQQNPWHVLGDVPPSLAPPTERPLAAKLWQRLVRDTPRRYQLILGPRRVGKTTVLYQTVRHLLNGGTDPRHIWWLRMDHPLLMPFDLGSLVRGVMNSVLDADQTTPLYLMLDELVYAKDWDLWLKTFYDERWRVQIAATSSATAALRDRRMESGVGRWSEQYLTPYQFPEYLDLIDHPYEVRTGHSLAETLRYLPRGQYADADLMAARSRFMLVGGFPELLAADHGRDRPDEDLVLGSQQILRSDAVERAVYKDIPQSFGVDNPILLERLLYVLAAQVTGILSPAKISRELGMSQPTFDRYLSYLEHTFLVFTLPNYSGREATVQKRGRKLYFYDGAVRNAALQRGLAVLDNPTELGLLIENLVAASLQTHALRSGIRLHHWRDGNHEVDLIYAHPTQPLAFEIASSPDHSRSGLRHLIQRHRRFRGNCYLVAPRVPVIHPDATTGIGTLPLDLFLLAIGTHANQ